MTRRFAVGNEMKAGVLDTLRTLWDWAPFLNKIQVAVVVEAPRDKALAIIDALEIPASKTSTTFDDGLLVRLEAVLKTQEGKDLLDWCVDGALGKI
jgi:hypothetical protein